MTNDSVKPVDCVCDTLVRIHSRYYYYYYYPRKYDLRPRLGT